MKHFLIFLILVAVCGYHYSSAQNTERLKLSLNEAEADTSKVILLARLGFEYAFIDPDTSRQYSTKAIELAKSIGFTRGQADAVNNLAISYDIEGNHKISLNYFLEALDLYESIGLIEGQARIYNNCGMVYQSLGEMSKSLEFHNKSLQLEIQLGDSTGMAYSMIHVASLYLDQNNYKEATRLYSSARLILETLGDEDGLSYAYLGLGELFYNQKKSEIARSYLNKALNLFKAQENIKGSAESNLILARISLLNANYRNAEQQFLRALKMSEGLEAKNIVLESLMNLSELYKRQNNFEESLSYFERYAQMQDSIESEEMAKNINEIQSRYDFEKQAQKIALLNKEKEYQTNLRNIFIGMWLSITILLIFLFRTYLFKSKALKILKSKNEEIKHKNSLIEVEKQHAIEAARAKSDFLSVMSHEIRTPMNAVIGTTHLLMHKDPKPEQLENLQILKYSADNLMTLINDILDLTKMESGRLTLESAPFNLNELTQGMLGIYKKEAALKGIRFELNVDRTIPVELIGDSGRLSQVLNNLISNAMKFTEEGTVKLSIKLLKLTNEKIDLEFMVEDSGIGIDEDKVEMIFESFSQADSNITRKYGGTGLGLSITKNILNHFGSEIHVESIPMTGSKFSFELSFGIQRIFQEHLKKNDQKEKIEGIKGKKIIAIDDNKSSLLITKSLLNKWKIEHTLVENAKDAFLELTKNEYDLLLLDLRMPDMDGFEFTHKLRASNQIKNSNVPIVAVSATSDIKIKDKVHANGMDDYLQKPFDPSRLLDIIYKHTTSLN